MYKRRCWLWWLACETLSLYSVLFVTIKREKIYTHFMTVNLDCVIKKLFWSWMFHQKKKRWKLRQFTFLFLTLILSLSLSEMTYFVFVNACVCVNLKANMEIKWVHQLYGASYYIRSREVLVMLWNKHPRYRNEFHDSWCVFWSLIAVQWEENLNYFEVSHGNFY